MQQVLLRFCVVFVSSLKALLFLEQATCFVNCEVQIESNKRKRSRKQGTTTLLQNVFLWWETHSSRCFGWALLVQPPTFQLYTKLHPVPPLSLSLSLSLSSLSVSVSLSVSLCLCLCLSLWTCGHKFIIAICWLSTLPILWANVSKNNLKNQDYIKVVTSSKTKDNCANTPPTQNK